VGVERGSRAQQGGLGHADAHGVAVDFHPLARQDQDLGQARGGEPQAQPALGGQLEQALAGVVATDRMDGDCVGPVQPGSDGRQTRQRGIKRIAVIEGYRVAVDRKINLDGVGWGLGIALRHLGFLALGGPGPTSRQAIGSFPSCPFPFSIPPCNTGSGSQDEPVVCGRGFFL